MSRVSYLNTYTPTWTRRLRSYANSGFYARELDAEDHAFIEGIRTRGCIDVPMSGDEVVRRSALVEEMEFWTNPFGIEPHVEHRLGVEAIQQHRAEVELSRALHRAQLTRMRELRAKDKAMAQAELERERAAWLEAKKAIEQERARRLAQTAKADLEWERAAPPDEPSWRHWEEEYSSYQERHQRWREARRAARYYVPEWKRNEDADLRAEAFYARNVKRWRKHAKAALKLAREVAKGQAEEAERQANLAKGEARAEAARKGAATRAERIQAALLEEAQREANVQAVENRLQPGECEPGTCRQDTCCPTGRCAVAVEQIKRLLCTHINGSFPHRWSVGELMTATRCWDPEFVLHCANQCVRDGRIRNGE